MTTPEMEDDSPSKNPSEKAIPCPFEDCPASFCRYVDYVDHLHDVHNAVVATPGDSVNHPPHYTTHPSGVECITVTEHMNFCRGNAVKYIWRAGEKGSELQDLKKARWYIDREIARLENG